jgi:hypothetical protein
VIIKDDDEALSYHNSVEPTDVNGDRLVSAIDALIVINELNARGNRVLPSPPTPKTPWSFYDVNNDGRISAIDALVVINRLNSRSLTAGEPQPPTDVSAAADSAASEPFSGERNGPDASASPLTGTTVTAQAADAVFSLASNADAMQFACNNRVPVYRETYRRQGSPRFSS